MKQLRYTTPSIKSVTPIFQQYLFLPIATSPFPWTFYKSRSRPIKSRTTPRGARRPKIRHQPESRKKERAHRRRVKIRPVITEPCSLPKEKSVAEQLSEIHNIPALELPREEVKGRHHLDEYEASRSRVYPRISEFHLPQWQPNDSTLRGLCHFARSKGTETTAWQVVIDSWISSLQLPPISTAFVTWVVRTCNFMPSFKHQS